MLKRKHGDRADWKRVLEKRYAQAELATETFAGHLSLLSIVKVSEPLCVSYGDSKLCIADDGYLWLQQFPSGKRHSVTTMFDSEGRIVQWYIDICQTIGLNEDNVPWIDDLFLDIVVLPSGETIQKDASDFFPQLAI
ncbi:DUF402 domain-containing protein [Paenibacillus arenilitoris]|uniref:DUF402 domain-containing protein n=1 Tax=Paenibacillus arenilitoris TaxID=2772299 RepID=UPI001CC2554E|nr:DUF402 domain-containing protein [Paenibacillus arenilitoris]